ITESARGGTGAAAALAIGFRKEGSGTLLLQGDNTDFVSTGTTFTVDQGVARISNSNALGRLNELQQLTVGGSSGSFCLVSNNVTILSLNFTPTAAQIQAALEGLQTIGVGNVAVEQFTTANNTFRIRFQGQLADQNVSQLVATSNGLSTLSITTVR